MTKPLGIPFYSFKVHRTPAASAKAEVYGAKAVLLRQGGSLDYRKPGSCDLIGAYPQHYT